MSNTLLIEPLVLDPADFPPLPLTPGFAQMVNDELGDQATPLDGFDSVFDELVGIVDALDAAIGAMGDELLSAFGEADTIDAAPVGDTVAGFAGALPASSSAVDDLGTLLSGTTPPGGGGGGGTPPGAQCQGEQDFAYYVPVPVTATITYSNPTTATYHVKSKTFTQDKPGVFTEDDNIPDTLTPGGSWVINVTYAAHSAAGTSGRLTIVTDAPNSPNVLCVHLLSTAAGGGGKGSGGGPRR